MAPRRRKKRGGLKALLWLFLGLVAVGCAGFLLYQFVITYDFEGLTPGIEPVQTFLPEGEYIRAEYPPYDPSATIAPTPVPTPMPTQVPLEKYSKLDKRILIPDTNYEEVRAGLTEFSISAADDNRVFSVRGWGYIAGLNAANNDVYLVVSSKYGDNHRAYLMTRESGSTGVLHPEKDGINLDQADFVGSVRIENTYASGEYRLGVVVAGRTQTNRPMGYTRLNLEYNFVVQSGRIIGMAMNLQ